MTRFVDRHLAGYVARSRAAPWRAVGAWAGFVLVVWVVALTAGGEATDRLAVPGSESDRAADLAEEASIGGLATIDATLVFHVTDGRVDEQDRADAIDNVLVELSHETGLSDPDRPFVDGQVSADGRTAFAHLRYGWGEPPGLDEYEELLALEDRLAPLGITVAVGGLLPEVVADPSPGPLEYVGILIALGVLTVALGSVRRALWPVVSAGVAVVAALGGITLLSTAVAIPSFAVQLAALVGLGIGIDDGLLLVSRWAAAANRDEHQVASVRAGRSVVLAGGTVVVSLLGLAVTGIPFFAAMGIATAGAVLAVGLASLTLLPALLVIGGVDGPAEVWASQPAVRGRRILARFCARPWTTLAAGIVIVLLLAAPATRLDLGHLDAGTVAPGETRRVAHDLLEEGFGPGWTSPFTVVIDHVDSLPWERGAITDRVLEAVRGVDGVATTLHLIWGHEGGEAAFRVVPTVAITSPESTTILEDVRAAVAGAVRGTGSVAAVGGEAATRLDVAARVEHRLGWMIAVVVALSTLLLVAAWRAPVLALKAAVLNGMSVAAAYGVLVMVFQWGWGASLIGLTETVPIDPIVPVFLFAILFGLSMDYEVFLISAVREHHVAGEPSTEAIVGGLSARWRVVGVAAVIMTAVFVGFVAGADPVTKMFGVGLSAAVIVDATVARGLLVPAALAVLGRWNWWVPSWLRPAAPRPNEAREETPVG